MPLPRVIARLNNRYTNRLIEPLVARLPGFIRVVHVGRTTGRTYRTPLYSFRANGQLLVALTYGPAADWVQNVLAGDAVIEQGDQAHALTSTALVGRDVALVHVPRIVRLGLRLLRVTDFMLLSVASDPER